MVDEYERSEKMVSFLQGLRLGWSRVAGKLFLIDLSTLLPVILVFSFLFFLAISPLFLFGLESIFKHVVSVFGIILIVSAGLLLISFFLIVAAVILSITRPVMHQACAVDDLGAIASIHQGFRLLKTRFSEVIITWIVGFAVRFVWTITVTPVMIIFFPVMLFTILFDIMIGAMLTLLVASIASLFVSTIFAFPLFFLVAFLPITFLSGLVEVFKSTFWTLSYREFRLLTNAALQPADQPKEIRLGAVLAQ